MAFLLAELPVIQHTKNSQLQHHLSYMLSKTELIIYNTVATGAELKGDVVVGLREIYILVASVSFVFVLLEMYRVTDYGAVRISATRYFHEFAEVAKFAK